MPATASAIQLREDRALDRAQRIIERRWQDRAGPFHPRLALLHFFLRMRDLEREVFDVAFLDVRLHLIATERMFSGGLSGAEVHVREVVRAALLHNAAGIIVAHNHPSGNATPSQSDNVITARLQSALSLVEVQLVDHLIVGGRESYSYSAEGKLR